MKHTVGFLSLLILLLACKEENPPSGPPPPPTPKDPREYTWIIDTIAYPGSLQTLMRDIWGSSPEDVWIVGHNERGYGQMFHYNGTVWSATSLPFGPIDFRSISGFGAQDVYAVGGHLTLNPLPPPNILDSTLIVHYNGVSWTEMDVERTKGLWEIEGTGSDNLWVSGLYGALYHYDGVQWALDSVPSLFGPEAEWLIYGLGIKDDSVAYMLANAHVNAIATDYYKFLRRSSSTWEVVDSFLIGPGSLTSKWGVSDLWIAPSGEMYSCGADIFIWDGVQWTSVLSTTVFQADMDGTRNDHIFSVGPLATVHYFDGTGWTQLETHADTRWSFTGVWCNDDEVFIVGYDGNKTCVVHGN